MRFFGHRKIGNRRRTARKGAPALTAFYWTGGAPRPFKIRDVTGSGAYIETEEQWTAGSLINLVLKNDAIKSSGDTERNFALWAQIVRVDEKGMAVEFVLMNRRQARDLDRFLESAIRQPKERDNPADGVPSE